MPKSKNSRKARSGKAVAAPKVKSAPKTPPKLIICTTCGSPLNELDVYSGASGSPRSVGPRTGTYEGTVYLHPERDGGFDHEPQPGLAAGPGDVSGVCDFCGDPDPSVVWLTGNGAMIRIIVGPVTNDYGQSPWSACQPCSAIIARRNLAMLLQRDRRPSADRPEASRNQRRAEIKMRTKTMRAFLDSRPHGPYPITRGL